MPNLTDYAGEYKRFNWRDAWKLLDGLPGEKGYNIAHEAVDRHAAGPKADKVSIRELYDRVSLWCDRGRRLHDGGPTALTFGERAAGPCRGVLYPGKENLHLY